MNKHIKPVKSIPYGLSDYERISTENYYYVDKTSFLNNIQTVVKSFLNKYSDYLLSPDREELRNELKTMGSAADMIDRNVRIDYDKLRHLIILDGDKTGRPVPNGNFEYKK